MNQIAYQKYPIDLNPKEQLQNQMHQKNSSSRTKIKTHTLHKSNLSQIWFNKYPNPNAKPNQTHIDFTAYTHKSKFKCKTKSDPDENTHIQIDIRINKQNPQTKTNFKKPISHLHNLKQMSERSLKSKHTWDLALEKSDPANRVQMGTNIFSLWAFYIPLFLLLLLLWK